MWLQQQAKEELLLFINGVLLSGQTCVSHGVIGSRFWWSGGTLASKVVSVARYRPLCVDHTLTDVPICASCVKPRELDMSFPIINHKHGCLSCSLQSTFTVQTALIRCEKVLWMALNVIKSNVFYLDCVLITNGSENEDNIMSLQTYCDISLNSHSFSDITELSETN